MTRRRPNIHYKTGPCIEFNHPQSVHREETNPANLWVFVIFCSSKCTKITFFDSTRSRFCTSGLDQDNLKCRFVQRNLMIFLHDFIYCENPRRCTAMFDGLSCRTRYFQHEQISFIFYTSSLMNLGVMEHSNMYIM